MTFREKLQMEHPEIQPKVWTNACVGCPSDYGYEPKGACEMKFCEHCWNREMPNTELEKVKEAFSEIGNAISKATEDVYKEDMNTAYNKGLKDAWELIRRIAYLDIGVLDEMFNCHLLESVAKKYTYKDALAILKTYEPKVGDVVKIDDTRIVITSIRDIALGGFILWN